MGCSMLIVLGLLCRCPAPGKEGSDIASMEVRSSICRKLPCQLPPLPSKIPLTSRLVASNLVLGWANLNCMLHLLHHHPLAPTEQGAAPRRSGCPDTYNDSSLQRSAAPVGLLASSQSAGNAVVLISCITGMILVSTCQLADSASPACVMARVTTTQDSSTRMRL